MSLLGPVFFYDLVRQSRRPFIPILRIAYLSGLFLVLCVSAYFWSSRYPQGLPPLVNAGLRATMAHATAEGRRIEQGDVVYLEMAASVKR